MSQTVLEVRDLRREVQGRVIITNLSFRVLQGETLFVRGASGVGKSLLLRCLALLDPLQAGTLTLDEETPQHLGVPQWRSLVTYVPQSRVQPKGTPSELYFTAQQFKAQKGRERGDLPALVSQLGLDQGVLNQPWVELSACYGGFAAAPTLEASLRTAFSNSAVNEAHCSQPRFKGGQSQRVTLAIALALKPKFLLLDEPSSALDQDSTLKLEQVLKNSGCGLVWVTHDDSQPGRVGGRIIHLPLGTEMAVEHLLASPRTTDYGGPDQPPQQNGGG